MSDLESMVPKPWIIRRIQHFWFGWECELTNWATGEVIKASRPLGVDKREHGTINDVVQLAISKISENNMLTEDFFGRAVKEQRKQVS